MPMPLTHLRARSARVIPQILRGSFGPAFAAHLISGGLMLFAALFVVIFSIITVALAAGMLLRRESILGLYAVIAALVAAVGAVVLATMSGDV